MMFWTSRASRFLAAMFLATALSACKVELYSEITESEANEMVALLLSRGIDAEKGAVDKGLVTLNGEAADLSAAIEILNQNGYPRDSFTDLGQMFGEQGLISSPLEERVRYVFGLSQAISETLTQIDGVITSRVHIVMPERSALAAEPARSTASVFLKTAPGYDLSDRVASVKMLVQASVERLAFEDVVVVTFEADPPVEQRNPSPPMVDIMGFRYPADQQGTLILYGGFVGLVVLLLLIGNLYLLLRVMRPKVSKSQLALRNG